MKKQIVYPKFIPRLFSSALDLALLSLVSPIIMNIIARIVYMTAFREFLYEQNISWFKFNIDISVFHSEVFRQYLQDHHQFMKYLSCIILLTTINIMLMGTYFISFWLYKGATLGKMLMNMRVVDANTLGLLSKKQAIKRFIGYITGLVGVWGAIFTQRRQAMHDKIANTVVIKA